MSRTMPTTMTNRQKVLDAVIELSAASKAASRVSVAELTGLPFTIVDENLRALLEQEKISRLTRGTYAPVNAFPAARPVSVTTLCDGVVKVEVGDCVLDLIPTEARRMGALLAGYGLLPWIAARTALIAE